MGMTREEFLKLDPQKRADFLIAALSSAGKLPEEKAREFVRIAQNATPMLKAARVVTMRSHTTKIPKLIFADPILKADPGDGVAVSSGNRTAPTTSEITLTSKEVVATVKLGDQALMDNVEGEDFEATLMTLIAERVGVDLEALALGSDTTIVDATMVANGYAQQDGWLKLISSNVVNFSNGAVTKARMQALLTAVQLKYRQQQKHQYFVEEYAGETWRDLLGDRATALGDRAILEGALPPCNGKPVVQVGNMPVTTGTPNVSSILFTDPRNLLLGVYKDITIETDRRPQERATYIVVSMRVAFGVEHEAAAAKGNNVLAR